MNIPLTPNDCPINCPWLILNLHTVGCEKGTLPGGPIIQDEIDALEDSGNETHDNIR